MVYKWPLYYHAFIVSSLFLGKRRRLWERGVVHECWDCLPGHPQHPCHERQVKNDKYTECISSLSKTHLLHAIADRSKAWNKRAYRSKIPIFWHKNWTQNILLKALPQQGALRRNSRKLNKLILRGIPIPSNCWWKMVQI